MSLAAFHVEIWVISRISPKFSASVLAESVTSTNKHDFDNSYPSYHPTYRVNLVVLDYSRSENFTQLSWSDPFRFVLYLKLMTDIEILSRPRITSIPHETVRHNIYWLTQSLTTYESRSRNQPRRNGDPASTSHSPMFRLTEEHSEIDEGKVRRHTLYQRLFTRFCFRMPTTHPMRYILTSKLGDCIKIGL